MTTITKIERNRGPIVAVFGSPLQDVHIRIVNKYDDELVEDGLAPGGNYVKEEEVKRMGGKGPNVAVALARLGCRPFLVGLTGKDEEGEKYRYILNKEGVNTDWLDARVEKCTGQSVFFYTKRGPMEITSQGAATLEDPQRISQFYAATRGEGIGCAVTPLVAYSPKASFSSVTRRIAQEARNLGILTFGDISPHYGIDTHRDMLHLFDIASFNEHEIAQVSGIDVNDRLSNVMAAERVFELTNRDNQKGTSETIITMGRRGATHRIRGNGELFIPGIPIREKSAVGAGDSLRAAFLAARLQGLTREEALIRGVVAGAMTTEQGIGYEGMPTKRELDNRVKQLRRQGLFTPA